MPEFYQDCHSQRDVIIKTNSEYVPLYGAGPSLQQAIIENRHIALGLTISVKSLINLFGNLVKKHFTEVIACNVLLNPNTGIVSATYCEPPLRQEGGGIRRLRKQSPWPAAPKRNGSNKVPSRHHILQTSISRTVNQGLWHHSRSRSYLYTLMLT